MSDIIKDGLIGAKWDEDKARRILRERDYFYYNDDHNFLVRDGYQLNYSDADENDKSIRAGTFLEDLIYRRVSFQEAMILAQYIETDNLTRRVITDKAILFKVPPVITIEGSEKQQENFKLLLEQTNFYAVLRELQRLTELHYDTHAIPQVRKKKMNVDLILSQDAYVEQDENDPTEFTKFFYQVGAMDNTATAKDLTTYIYWDEDGKHKCNINLDGSIDKKTCEDIPSIWDKHDIIPITAFRNYVPINTYWSPRVNYLVEKNIQIDLRITGLNMLEDYNLPQKVRVGMDDKVEGKIGLTFTEDILRSDEGEAIGSVNYINPNAPIKDEKDVIAWRKQEVAVGAGLSADSLTGKTFTSGFELFLSKSEIIEKNKEDRPYYLGSLKELLTNMMIAAEEIDMRFPKDPKISINFGELIYTQSPEEQARTRAAKIMAGIWSAVQSIMEDDPDLTEEEAIKKVEQIKKWSELNKPANPFGEEVIEDEPKGDEE